MPQIFQVLRCYKCLVFQVHLTKKSIKWDCKLCGEKQSIKRNYGIGTARDCRIHVQKLNSMRGEIDELKCGQMKKNADSDEERDMQSFELEKSLPQPNVAKDSKWSNYIEEDTLEEARTGPMCLGDTEVVLEIPKKRRKQFKNDSKSNYNSKAVAVDPCILQKACSESKENKLLHYNMLQPEFCASTNIPITKAVQSDVSLGQPSIQKETLKLNVPIKKFVPPVINKNSKWAQYAEDQAPDESLSQGINMSQNELMFSLCDDSELDSVLDL